MNRTLRYAIYLLLLLLGLSPAVAQENAWPKTVALEQGSVTIYEPQVDEMSEDFIRFRAALAYREKPGAEPVFGAGWFEGEVQLNRFSGTVHPVGLQVTQTRFPVEADVQNELSRAMAQPSFAANFSFDHGELQASMKAAEAEAEAAERLNTAPPKIIYRDRPALLVTIDGEPVLREIENSSYRAVINTPYPLIHDGRHYYLNAARDVWYRADGVMGPYRYIDEAPAEITLMVKVDAEQLDEEQTLLADSGSPEISAANAPEIVVSTEPAELVVTDGPAAFVPLVDDLLVLNNSTDDVFMNLEEQAYYIVLAGRWYRSESLDGPWAYRDSDDLPDVFARIPGDSEQADSRVYVAGTDEAEEAVLDAQVPQTAAVKRGVAEVDVQYDGTPDLEPVDGTDMQYVRNTGSTVILSEGLYYLVEDGVWYVSRSYDGPWQVAVTRPDQVRVIQPTSPVYNVKYVYVYDYTPDVVYVGYTPGYLGSYVYRSTVFYGSGWYYRPWVSPRYYYPYHRTWGFHVNYDPWYGWNFGLSWAWGPFSVSFWPGGHWHRSHYWHHRYYSYWGPHGYRPRHHHYRPPRHHYRPPGHHRPPGHGGDYRPHRPYERNRNLYRDEQQRALIADSRDKRPATWDRSRTVKKAYENGGKKYASKGKSLPTRPLPVSRNQLAVKAKASERDFERSKSKMIVAASSKSYAASGGKISRVPPAKVGRDELAAKTKRYGSVQKKVLPGSAGKSYTGKVKRPVSKAPAPAQVKGSPDRIQPDTRGKSKYVVRKAGGSTKAVTALPSKKSPGRIQPNTRSQSKYVVPKVSAGSKQAASRSKYVKSVPTAKAPSVFSRSKPAYTRSTKKVTTSRPKSPPVVKLTRPQSSNAYAKSRQSAPKSYSASKTYKAPNVRSAPKVYSAPKQQASPRSYGKSSAPKPKPQPKYSQPRSQKSYAPPKSVPKKSSKPAARHKSKK